MYYSNYIYLFRFFFFIELNHIMGWTRAPLCSGRFARFAPNCKFIYAICTNGGQVEKVTTNNRWTLTFDIPFAYIYIWTWENRNHVAQCVTADSVCWIDEQTQKKTLGRIENDGKTLLKHNQIQPPGLTQFFSLIQCVYVCECGCAVLHGIYSFESLSTSLANNHMYKYGPNTFTLGPRVAWICYKTYSDLPSSICNNHPSTDDDDDVRSYIYVPHFDAYFLRI